MYLLIRNMHKINTSNMKVNTSQYLLEMEIVEIPIKR